MGLCPGRPRLAGAVYPSGGLTRSKGILGISRETPLSGAAASARRAIAYINRHSHETYSNRHSHFRGNPETPPLKTPPNSKVLRGRGGTFTKVPPPYLILRQPLSSTPGNRHSHPPTVIPPKVEIQTPRPFPIPQNPQLTNPAPSITLIPQPYRKEESL